MTRADYAARFRSEVTKTGRCTLWRPNGDSGPDYCSGPLDACHWLPKAWLLDRFGDDETGWRIAYDPRCGFPLCRHHHHLSHHSPTFRFFREDIPPTCWEWARENEIEFRLVRDYGPRESGVEAA